MRIDNSATITIFGRGAHAEALGALEKGGVIGARIVERIDTHRAVLEIAGRRVSANFVNGLPSAGRLDLLLEKRTGSTFVFRLVAEDPKAAARERLLDLTPFARSDTGRIPFGRAPTDGLVGVYAYSSLLFRLSGGVEKKTGLSEVLNALAARGIKIESLLFFSFLFSDFEGINLNCLASVLAISEREGRRRHNQSVVRFAAEDGSFDGTGGILDALDEFVGESQSGEEIIRQLSHSLLDAGAAGELSARSGIIYFHDEGFREARYIGSADGMAVEADFSQLGHVELLAREWNDHIRVDVFCDNGVVRDEIASDRDHLAATIGSAAGMNCTVSVRSIDRAMDVIREQGAFLLQGGEFDARA